MWGIRATKYFLLIILGGSLGIMTLNVEDVYSATTQWNSDFTAGILKTESSEFGINLQVSTFEKNAIKLEWQEPDTKDKIIGYKILKKTLDTEYVTHVENTNSLELFYVDSNLQKGFYGYKVIPIIQKHEPQIISMHGIDRNHSLFPAYLKGQELLAQALLEQNCPLCFEKPFGEIYNEFHIVK